MPSALPISAYVVLGLLARRAGVTPYQLDKQIRESIGFFWGFPRSQLYAEAGRLVRRGLAVENQEESGRRRRTLSITEAGRVELDRWRGTRSETSTEIHDEGLLRLFFQPEGGSVAQLAEEQLRAHEQRLEQYEQLMASGRLTPGTPRRATLELGLRLEHMFIEFWREATDPATLPGSPTPDRNEPARRPE